MHKYWLTICLLMGAGAHAQLLTLQDAVAMALKNNYAIQIARNEAEIAHIQNNPGASGMLPSVTLNANENPSFTNLRQELANGQVIERDNVFSNNLNTNITIGYTLFDGMRMFATRQRLRELEALGQQRMKANIQNTISEVIQRYSQVVAQQGYLKVVSTLQEISQKRLELVQVRKVAGLANNTDLYLAELDMEAAHQTYINQELLLKAAFADLNTSLNLPVDSTYTVQEAVAVNQELTKAKLDSAYLQNPELQMGQSMVQIALQSQKEWQGNRYPTLRLNAAYGYALTQSQAGFTLFNQNYGPNAGISFSMPLYNGSVNTKNIEVAKLQHRNTELSLKQTELSIRAAFEKAWQRYEASRIQIQSDTKSKETAAAYLELMQLRYKQGQSTILEFREAQRSYEETNFRLLSNTYQLKQAETDLLRITGQLVK